MIESAAGANGGDSVELDLAAWAGVRADLLVVADATRRDYQTRPFAASALHRLAAVHLETAITQDADALTSGLAGASLRRLQRSLREQMAGRVPEYAILEALRPEVRAHAARQISEALTLDPNYVPALRLQIALSRISGDWATVVRALERLLEVDQRPGARAHTFEILADVHWHELGKPNDALGYLQAAIDAHEAPPERLDKLLKLNLELESWDEAVTCCEQLIELVNRTPDKAPLAVTYRLTLGEIHLYGLDQPGVALRHYLFALGLMPHYELTYTLLRELLAAHPWSTLAGHYHAVDNAVAPPGGEAFEKLADAFANLNDPTRALAALREAYA